jgi:hypothetical protein
MCADTEQQRHPLPLIHPGQDVQVKVQNVEKFRPHSPKYVALFFWSESFVPLS